MKNPIQDQQIEKNIGIHPNDFSIPNAQADSGGFKLSGAHIALFLIAVLSILVLTFVSLARSVEVRAIEAHLTKPGKFLTLKSDISFASALKLPLGNRVLLMPGQHQVSLSVPGYQPLTRALDVGSEANQSFELQLVRLPGELDIQLKASNGEPIEQAATALIDGQGNHSAPALIKEVAAGYRELSVDAPLYRPVTQKVLIKGKGERQSLTLSLEPAWAEYSFNSQPEGAKVLIDGELRGQTPLTIKLEEGRRSLSIQADKFKPYERNIGVVAGLDLEVPSVDLIPADGTLNLSSSPTGAAVILNQEYQGNTPLTLRLSPNETQNLKLYKAGYQIQTNEVIINAAQTKDQSIKLKSDVIAVKLSVSPSDATVLVDGKARGQGSQTLNLSALPHKIVVSKNGYVPYTSEIIPTRASEQLIKVKLLTKEQHYWAQIPDSYSTRAGQKMMLFRDLGAVSLGSSRREDGRRANEAAYAATLTKPFYVSTTETTNKQFREFRSKHTSGNYKAKSLDAQKAPVSNISWQDAARYCNWLSKKEGLDLFYQTTKGFISGFNEDANGYRLLTEVEWAWLARNKGSEVLLYPWGNADTPNSKIGNYADIKAESILSFTLADYDDGYKGPAPVGRFEPNHRGIYDLDGNVSEWMHDWYSARGNSELKGNNALVDPTGPEIGEFHVVRGASWAKGYLPQLRLAYRDYAAKGKHDIGFRVARYAGLNKGQ